MSLPGVRAEAARGKSEDGFVHAGAVLLLELVNEQDHWSLFLGEAGAGFGGKV